MHRSLKVPVGFVACALALVAAVGCSSSSKTPTIATVPGPGGVGAMPVDICSVVSSKQVKDLLGVAAVGRPTVSASYYETCDWTGPGSDTFDVGIIRLGKGQQGFGSSVSGLNPTVVTGLGDKATFSSGRSSKGLNFGLLVANKGTVSLSLTVGTQAARDAVSDQKKLTDLAQGIFTALGA